MNTLNVKVAADDVDAATLSLLFFFYLSVSSFPVYSGQLKRKYFLLTHTRHNAMMQITSSLLIRSPTSQVTCISIVFRASLTRAGSFYFFLFFLWHQSPSFARCEDGPLDFISLSSRDTLNSCKNISNHHRHQSQPVNVTLLHVSVDFASTLSLVSVVPLGQSLGYLHLSTCSVFGFFALAFHHISCSSSSCGCLCVDGRTHCFRRTSDLLCL